MARILVVEDNPLNRKLITHLLRGHVCLLAEDGEKGIEMAKAENPDLILMDIRLPGMDGLSAAKILRADAKTQGIPLIAVTASAMKGDGERILASGFDAYIAKPIDFKDFRETISSILERSTRPGD